MNNFNKLLSIGIAAIGVAALASPSAFATPTMTITVGSESTSVTLTNVSTLFGSGTYAADANSFDGFNYGGVFVTASGSSLTTQFGSVTNTTVATIPVTFSITQSGFSTGSSSINFKSMQISGSETTTGATNSQTVDFNGMVSPTSGSSTSQDSGALPLNTLPGVSPSSSVSYNTPGINLATPSDTVSVTNSYTFDLNSNATVKGGLLVTNLSTASVITPEPASLGLLGLGGAVALFGLRRRKTVIA
ncbi:MAG: PEP-CTERM sorting domain-containing protein [Phycisphaerae bacterium]